MANWTDLCLEMDKVDDHDAQERAFFAQHVAPAQAPFDPSDVLGDTEAGMICPACGQRDTQYTMRATRSADEGMTAFCSCRKCKHQWTLCA
jgi:DNA-directed RNA polymerase subunit M/transcription elongation factor TFIIS